MISKNIKSLIRKEVKTWSESYLEIPNIHLNKMPACPYAKKAWQDKKVDIKIRDPGKGYISNLHEHVKALDFNKKRNTYLLRYIF